MKYNNLTNFILERLYSVEHNISCYSRDMNSEYLHSLRVDIKKIEAYFSFARKVCKVKYDNMKLKRLFKKSGEIREIQINIQLLSSFPETPIWILTKLKKEEFILNRKFNIKSSKYISSIEDFRKNICHPKKSIKARKIKEYFSKMKDQSNNLVKNPNREELHKYRKKIKMMLYVNNILPEKLKNVVDLNEVVIKKQQEKLGNWHDIYAGINLFSKEIFPKNNSESLQKLKEKELRQFSNLLTYLKKNRI